MDTIRGTSSVPLSQQPLAVQTTIQPRALSPTHQLPVPPSQRKHSADGSHAAKHMGSPAKSSPQRAVVVPSNKDHQLSAQNRQDSSFPDSSFPDSNGLHSEYDYEYEYELLEQDPGWVFDKLVSMGFNSNLSAHAVQGATTTLEKTKDQTNLLRCALYIAFLNSLEDHTEPRSVQFQFPATPSRYQPNHRTLKPAKGILREHSVMHDNNKSKQLFRKDWFDKAIGSLGLGPTTSKRSTSAGAFGSLFSKASLPDTSKGSETPLIVIPLRKNSAPLVPISSPDRPEIMQTSSASSQHARVESPDGSQPSKPSLSSRAHVRFTFPDVAIAPRDSDYDMFISPLQAVPKSADANTKGKSNDLGTDPTPEKTGSSSNASGQRGETHSKSRVEPSSIIVKHSNEFTPSELYRYYMQLLVHEDRTHMPALVNILRESVENNIFPKTINLSGVSITMSHAKAFTELLMIDFGLKCLNIEKCGLDDEVLKMVMQSALGSSTLSWLSLANNPKVKTQGVKYIAVFLKKSSSIRYLDISGISLDQQGASYLNHAFSADSEKGFRQSSVEVLKMDNSSIKSVHLEVMATGIRRSRLTHLSMRRNLLSAHAGKQLARILENTESCGSSNPILHGSSLKALDVRDNAIGSGVVDIAQALALNDQLTRLVLRSNRVDAAGFTAVVNALNTNSTLRTLDMGQNSLFSSEHPTAIESLKQMLCTNSVLSGIFLSNTNMRTNDLISLSEALPFSKCIQKLDLSHNVFEAPGFMALATVMESNTHITHIALSPLKSLKGKNSVDVDVETLNAIARMSTILNRNASSKKTDVLPPVSIRRSSSPQEMSSLDAEEEEEEESDTEVSPTPSALRRDSLVLSLEMRKTRRSMDTIRDGTLDTSLTNEMISKEAEAFRLQVEQRLRSAEETSSVLAEIVDLAHVQMKSGIRPSRSQCELLKQLRDESVHFQTKIYDTLSLVDKTIDRERLTVKSLEISDHINRTIKRHDDLEYSQIASKKVQSPLGAPADEKPAENMPESNPKKSVDYPQRSSSVANILAPLAIPEAPVPTLPLNPILPTSLKTAGPGALHPARKASLTTNFAAYPNSLLFLKNDGDSLKLSVLAHDGPTSSKTVISPSTSPNLASGSDLHTKVGHPANSGAHVPVAATLLPPTDSAQKRDNSSLVSLAGTIAGKRV